MEFWKRKKGAPQSPYGPNSPQGSGAHTGVSPLTISEPIHNMEPFAPYTSSATSIPSAGGNGGRSPVIHTSTAVGSPSQAEYLSNSFGDAEFRDRYKSYRQQRRLSHTMPGVPGQRTSNMSTGSNEHINRATTPVQQHQQQQESFQPNMGMMSRQRSHDADSMTMVPALSSAHRALSVASTASTGNEEASKHAATAGGPPRGSLRSTRSSASGRSNPGATASIVSTGGAGMSFGMMGIGDSRDSTYSTQSLRSASNGNRPAPLMQSASTMSVSSTGSQGGGRRSGIAIGAPAPAPSELDTESISEEEINLMLGRLMDEMDIKDAQRMQMQKMSVSNKLKLLKQHRQLESFQMDSKGNAPEYFYRYLTETDIRSLPKQMLVHLRVCVSTQPVNWVRQFVEMQGLEALSECLGILNHAGTRKGDDITKEMEITKCIKSMVNIQWGAQDVLRYPSCVHNLCFSIDAPSLLTRKLISEILTYICYLNVPTGHASVLKGLDKLQKFREMQKRFEPWMRALELAIDGRGRMGSKVGVSEELRQLGGTADRDLTDYVLSSMIFVNAVVGVSDD
ncbi:hypothetical protein LPJ73_004607, partial [Coemansia sp. RSA 2703]